MRRVRTDFGKISASRIANAAIRRAVDLKQAYEWEFGAAGQAAKQANRSLKDTHAGERCILICNGPSLNLVDMDLVKNEASICTNRSYLLFDDWGFTPTYFAAIADQVLEQFHDDIDALPMPKFLDFKHRSFFPGRAYNYMRIPPRLIELFSADISRPISTGGTVTYACLQILYHLGFTTVVIIGMDHRFKSTAVPNTTEVKTDEVDQDHAHPNYFPKGLKWQTPDLRRSEISYQLARDAYEKAGRRIIDATVGGACDVFEKMPLELALRA